MAMQPAGIDQRWTQVAVGPSRQALDPMSGADRSPGVRGGCRGFLR
jgi:hypothetical protein